MPKAYIIARRAISYRRYITRSARNGYHWKKSPLSVDKSDFFLGGGDGIRTLATLSRPTRFRVTPLRPAWVLLHNGVIIPATGGKSNYFLVGFTFTSGRMLPSMGPCCSSKERMFSRTSTRIWLLTLRPSWSATKPSFSSISSSIRMDTLLTAINTTQ